MKAKARLVDGFQSVIENGRNHSFITDLPATQEGLDTGATALEVSLMSFAGCVSTIYKVVANKMRLNVESLEVDMDGDKGMETFDKVSFTVKVKSNESKEKLQKCLDQTLKSCPVGVLFQKSGVEVSPELIVEN